MVKRRLASQKDSVIFCPGAHFVIEQSLVKTKAEYCKCIRLISDDWLPVKLVISRQKVNQYESVSRHSPLESE